MDSVVGEIAALGAAVAFSITSVCYTFAGRKINAVTSIAMSLPISWLILLGVHRLTLGTFFPVNATSDRWFFLGASGILVYVIASYFMLSAYQHIGPRLTMLIWSFAPVLGALLAWVFLGQNLSPNSAIGIAVAERGRARPDGMIRDIRRGVIYATLGMCTQATAFVLASRGVSGGFPPLSATLIRITAGLIALWVFIALRRNLKATATIFSGDLKLFLQLAVAALSGPVIAASLLLLSFQYVSVGVSTTLSNTTAIILIPLGYFIFKEQITLRAIIGTVVTIIGIAILFT